MDTQHPAVTFSNLTAVTKLLKKTNLWEPQSQLKEWNQLVSALDLIIGYPFEGRDIAVGVDPTTYADYSKNCLEDEFWFIQCALREMVPDYQGQVWWYLEDPKRSVQESVELIDYAAVLCVADLPLQEEML